MTRRVAVVIEPNKSWREIFAEGLRNVEFSYSVLSGVFVDDSEGTVFIVASRNENGQVVGPEYVSRLRVAHPDGLIIGVSADLTFVQRGAEMTVEDQFLAAGADHVIDKAKYKQEAFTQLLSQE